MPNGSCASAAIKVLATSTPVAEPFEHAFGTGGDDDGKRRGPAASTRACQFQSTPASPDKRKPRVVYVGAIDFRFDMELIEQLANEFPHVEFLNYGPVSIYVARRSMPAKPLFPRSATVSGIARRVATLQRWGDSHE